MIDVAIAFVIASIFSLIAYFVNASIYDLGLIDALSLLTFFNSTDNHPVEVDFDDKTRGLVEFCKTPRTRKEIADYLGLESISYVIKDYVMPLVEKGIIKLSIPDKPRSPKQLYFTE